MQNKHIEKLQVLNASHLKWIAMIAMFMDHFNKGILTIYLEQQTGSDVALQVLSRVFGVVGRLAFPIFLFLIVEAVIYTKSINRLFLRLFAFAIISEVPFDMMSFGKFADSGLQNMFFTLTLAVLCLGLSEQLRKKYDSWRAFAIVLTIMYGLMAVFLRTDYMFFGVFIPMIYYFFYQKRLTASLTNYLSYALMTRDLWSILGFFMVCTYNGKRGNINKWIGYVFYPLHLALIGYIRIYLLKG